jgi:hypothetical protein
MLCPVICSRSTPKRARRATRNRGAGLFGGGVGIRSRRSPRQERARGTATRFSQGNLFHAIWHCPTCERAYHTARSNDWLVLKSRKTYFGQDRPTKLRTSGVDIFERRSIIKATAGGFSDLKPSLDLEPSLQAKCPNSRCGVANDGFYHDADETFDGFDVAIRLASAFSFRLPLMELYHAGCCRIRFTCSTS